MKIKRCFSSFVMGTGRDVRVNDGDVRRKGKCEGLREKLGSYDALEFAEKHLDVCLKCLV